jgi:hypothetical protein
MTEHKQFMSAIALSDAPRLSRLIQVAINNHASTQEIVRHIQMANDGLYHVKSFTVST